MAETDVDQFLDVLSEGLTLQEDGVYLGEDAGLLIRERDNATRLALLDELQEMVETATHDGHPLLTSLIESADELRAKYQLSRRRSEDEQAKGAACASIYIRTQQ